MKRTKKKEKTHTPNHDPKKGKTTHDAKPKGKDNEKALLLQHQMDKWRRFCDERVEWQGRCLVCGGSGVKLFFCPECRSVEATKGCGYWFCSEGCMKDAQLPYKSKEYEDMVKCHPAKMCNQMKILGNCLKLIHNEKKKQDSLWIPSVDIPTLPESWSDFFTLCNLTKTTKYSSYYKMVLTHVLTFPLTIAITLHRLYDDLSQIKTLKIHILGAEKSDIAEAGTWGTLMRALPMVERIDFIFVGPEVADDLHGQSYDCNIVNENQGNLRTYSISYFKAKYHDLIADYEEDKSSYEEVFGNSSIIPDLAVAFNSGVADHMQDWGPTVEYLSANNISTLWTSYQKIEADFDSRVLKDMFDVDVIYGPQKNTFSSTLPLPDPFFPCKTYHLNNYTTLTKGKTNQNNNTQ